MSCKVQQSVCSDCVTYVKSRIKFNTFNTFNNVYRCNICDLIFLEGVAKCDGIEYLKAVRYTNGDDSIPIPMPKI